MLKRIVVAGGAGFLGSHLCEALLALGHEVICLDNFFSSARSNVFPLLKNPNFELIRHNVCEPLFLEVDEIYNLASPASPRYYQHDPVQTTKTNVQGSINLLGMAKRVGAKYLQASTSEIYGDPQVSPQPESYAGNVNPIGIRSCYDEGKRCAETLCFDYLRQYGVDVKVARIFNTYGPRMLLEDGRVVTNFMVQALKGEPLTIYGEGTQTRSFCFVSDLIEGLIRLMGMGSDFHGPVNLGNPREMTMLELAEMIIMLTGSKVGLVYLDPVSDDPKQRRPDIQLAKELLRWEPLVSLEEGLRRTLEYVRSALSDGAPTPFMKIRDVTKIPHQQAL